MREIRSLFRFIPFGKFSLSGRGKPPFNQVYVGRQKERSNFIELLTHQEKFGAFLISGHRGAGKSSFVEYCLNEYERMAFQRSIRISRGSQLASFFNLGLIALALIAVYFFLSQFLELAAQNTFEAILSEVFPESASEGITSSTVLWMSVPLLIGSLVMLIPAYMVSRTATAISEVEDTSWERNSRYWWTLAAMILLPALWLVGWQASQAVDFRFLLYGFIWTIIPLMTLSQLVQATGKYDRLSRSDLLGLNNSIIWLTVLAAILILSFKILSLHLPFARSLFPDLGLTLIPYTLVYVFTCRAMKAAIGKPTLKIKRAGLWIAVIVSVVLYLALSKAPTGDTWADRMPILISLLGLAPLALFMFVFWRARRVGGKTRTVSPPFAPVRTILIVKANFFILLSVVGLLPLARVIWGAFLMARETVESGGPAIMALDHFASHLPTLAKTHIATPEFLAILVIVTLIYRCEYLWICRDLRSFRQDHTLGLLGRASSQPDLPKAWPHYQPESVDKAFTDWLHDEEKLVQPLGADNRPEPRSLKVFSNARGIHRGSILSSIIRKSDEKGLNRALIAEQFGASQFSSRSRYVFRKLEHATLPYWIYSVRHPVMKVWINLGFDNLEHSRIVEAMLRRLRGIYRRRFINITSFVGGMNALTLLATAVLVTSLASKSLFHIGNISDFERDGAYTYRFEGNTVSSRDTFGATNYCGFFEVYPEIAPVAKSFVCALPFANGILELLYAPVLQIHTDFRSEVSLARRNFTSSGAANPTTDLATCSKEGKDHPLHPAQAMKDNLPITFMDWSKCLAKESDDDTLYKMFVGDPKSDAPQTLVGGSQLVRFVLDPNLGLPLIDYDTVNGRTTLWKATWLPAFSAYGEGVQGSPTMRVYHLLLYVLVFLFLFAMNRRLRILPYQANVDAMDELILLINGRETLHSGDQQPRGWLSALWPFRTSERTVETAGDPRVVEQRFIELLDKMRPHRPSYIDGPRNFFEICPEITFVFDEMDKLSGIVDPELSKDAEGQTQIEENSRERARSLQLHQLLSDMKRLISGNSARFIFIGGRLYHDEWLADQAQRAPILNSIFSGQIYLTSLMADRNHTFGRMNDRITELVVLMYRNARHRYHTWQGLRRAGPFIPSGQSEEPSYVQFELPFSSHPRRLSALAHLVDMKVVDADGELYSIDRGMLRDKSLRPANVEQSMGLGEQETFDQFINFLTYRSAGNPKKLKELIQSMMQTTSHAFALPRYPYETQTSVRWDKMRYDAHDVITLNDSAIYRMQFIDMLYRHLTDHVEGRMLERDDKVSMSIFYLMDFLMKFHNRGFSRTNLQRVDELSHIHRAPDLRSVMSLLVQVSSERFLHRVLNGVYNFRFRSDFAREIDYLSRISKEEMAALNFTLDESQSLKGLYQQTINTGERENIDTISGLGELYEYDQEYEIARNYYRRAIGMLDDVQAKTVMSKAVRHTVPTGKSANTDKEENPATSGNEEEPANTVNGETDAGRSYAEFGMFGDLLARQDVEGRKQLIASQVHWVVARLRLMLQVGQTYEQEQNFERANASYMHSARFSDIVLEALAQDQGDTKGLEIDRSATKGASGAARDILDEFWGNLFAENRSIPLIVLRNLSIFYQAGFAAAWVLEKDPENIDDSVVYAESWVKRIYDREPLLRYPLPQLDKYPMAPPFSGNILIQGALAHDRLGDLYFMKGQQSMKSVPFDVIVKSIASTDEDPELVRRMGYLGRAQYNYAMSLWLLRKYLTNRNRISKQSWGIGETQTEPFEVRSNTSSQFHVTLADALTDLAEVIFGTRSALRLSRDLCFPPNVRRKPYLDRLKLSDLNKYRRCVRALLNGGISRFNDNLIVPSGHKQSDADKLNWIFVAPDDENFGLDKDKEPTRTPSTEIDKMLELDWIKWAKKAKAPVHRDVLKTRWDEIEAKFRVHMLRHGLTFGKFSQWMGQRTIWKVMDKDAPPNPPHMDGLHINPPNNEMERLMAYKFFSQAAARANQAIGQSTNSSHEYFLQADALNSALWDARIVGYLASLGDFKNEKGDHVAPKDSVVRKFFVEIKGNSTASTRSDEDLFHIGLMSLTSILDAVKRIQFSDRPSTTRLALNHGNPENKDGMMAEENVDRKELRADYDMAQAFRDDPRAITQACSLILALLDKNAGRLCISLALLTYRDVLMRYANDTFRPDGENGDALQEVLAKYLADDLELPTDPKTLRALSKALYRETYAGLGVSLERYRYPILNRLNGLKILADALLLQTPEPAYEGRSQNAPKPDSDHLLNRHDFADHFGTERNSQIGRYVRELAVTGDVYGSDMHFPVDRAGQTMALTFLHLQHYGLHAIYDDMIADPPEHADTSTPERTANRARRKFLTQDRIKPEDSAHRPLLNETILTRESVGEMAVNRLSRSQESTSMGDAYYENVGYLNYLNDDFNDRSIHYYHATTMAHADMSELLSLIVKEGFYTKYGSS